MHPTSQEAVLPSCQDASINSMCFITDDAVDMESQALLDTYLASITQQAEEQQPEEHAVQVEPKQARKRPRKQCKYPRVCVQLCRETKP